MHDRREIVEFEQKISEAASVVRDAMSAFKADGELTKHMHLWRMVRLNALALHLDINKLLEAMRRIS